ncbi:anhydro-N-acetylmuramic acid kinase [Oerskovia sp. M15]
MIVLGLSSGTSVDAIDAAAADFHLGPDGCCACGPSGTPSTSGPPSCASASSGAAARPVDMGEVTQLDTLIGQEFGRAGRQAVDDVAGGDVDLIASHGQTLYHWVVGARAHGSLQLGNAAWIAERTRRPVISDFRVADIAAGGQGAPLVSVLDALWLGRDPQSPDGAPTGLSAALNIGGIANVTLVGEVEAPVTGWDTGPGNCLIDLTMRQLTGEPFDRDGALGATGTVDRAALRALLDDPYFAAKAPKSTGRELFDATYVPRKLASVRPDLTGADLVATLTELTAVTIAEGLLTVARSVPAAGTAAPVPTATRGVRCAASSSRVAARTTRRCSRGSERTCPQAASSSRPTSSGCRSTPRRRTCSRSSASCRPTASPGPRRASSAAGRPGRVALPSLARSPRPPLALARVHRADPPLVLANTPFGLVPMPKGTHR